MEAAVVDADVDVDDVAVFELTLIGDAVADYFVDGGADGFGEVAVIEWRGVCLWTRLAILADETTALITHVSLKGCLVHDLVDVVGCDARFDFAGCNIQDFTSKFANFAHAVLLRFGENSNLVPACEDLESYQHLPAKDYGA